MMLKRLKKGEMGMGEKASGEESQGRQLTKIKREEEEVCGISISISMSIGKRVCGQSPREASPHPPLHHAN